MKRIFNIKTLFILNICSATSLFSDMQDPAEIQSEFLNACRENNVQVMEKLFQTGHVNVNEITECSFAVWSYYRYPFQEALDHKEAMNWLLKNGLTLNHEKLELSIQSENLDLFNHIKQQLSISPEQAAILISASLAENRKDITKQLLNEKIKWDHEGPMGAAPMLGAILNKSYDLEHQEYVNFIAKQSNLDHINKQGVGLFQFAVHQKNLKAIQHLPTVGVNPLINQESTLQMCKRLLPNDLLRKAVLVAIRNAIKK